MDRKQEYLEMGMLLLAFLFLLSTRKQVGRLLADPDTVSAAVYLETGRMVRFQTKPETIQIESSPPETTAATEPVFSDTVEVFNVSSLSMPDLSDLLHRPLNWSLRQDTPTVLVYHTHTSESYESGTGEYHSADSAETVVAVGDALCRVLEEAGIRTIHDTTVYDRDYGESYDASLAGVQAIMAENPGICLLLDLHRDAAEAEGAQIVTTARVQGKQSGKILFICGSEGGGYEHPYWQENLSIALKLQSILTGYSEELCRPLQFCDSRYNQQFYPGSLLVEVGTAGNDLVDALTAGEYLGRAIAALAEGSG